MQGWRGGSPRRRVRSGKNEEGCSRHWCGLGSARLEQRKPWWTAEGGGPRSAEADKPEPRGKGRGSPWRAVEGGLKRPGAAEGWSPLRL